MRLSCPCKRPILSEKLNHLPGSGQGDISEEQIFASEPGAVDSARAARVCDDTRLLVRTRIRSVVAPTALSPLDTVL